MTEPITALHLDESVDLGHAWVQALADGRGIRVLFIKGPALHRHGLREERVSADVDVLVEPARFAELCEAMDATGWYTRPSDIVSERTTLHSKTYLRDGWPCDVDVHSFFPGFLAEPAEVFDALWERRVRMQFAHRECDVPDRVAGLLILALHSLRGSAKQARHGEELEQLMRVALTEREKSDAATLALATGSAATLETVLPRLGIDATPSAAELASPELREWRQRVASGSFGAYFWFVAIRRAPLRERPTLLWRAVWPTSQQLLLTRPETMDTARGRVRARVARWGRGIRSLPAAIRGLKTR